MFFFPVISAVTAVYVLAAVLPAVFLMVYIYRHDTVEPEPKGLLLRLIGLGVLSALGAMVVESLLTLVLNVLVPADSVLYLPLTAFVVVAASEEGMKFVLLRRRTWNHPAFNYRFDGVVYAVFVSLGFAAFENILYVFSYGLSVALPRALLSIPGHMSFAVVMGVFYSRARHHAHYGEEAKCQADLWAAWLVPVLLHGFYDACAMSGSTWSTPVFLLFVLVTYTAVFRLIKKESAQDAPV